MLCPTCQSGLAITDRQGIEIDYCPKCRGIWLDRGELDKIIDRAASATLHQGPAVRDPSVSPHPANSNTSSGAPRRHDDSDDDHFRNGGAGRERYPHDGAPRKKRESWLGELFDFG
jgi:Zn-finger nucleic acid-binding protein